MSGNRTREASIVEAGDKVLLMRTGYGGWTYIDRIVDVIVRPTPETPITSLQPAAGDTPGMPPTTPEGELTDLFGTERPDECADNRTSSGTGSRYPTITPATPPPTLL